MHDGIVQHPLGGGSYIFDKGLATPSLRYLGLIPSVKPPKLPKSGVDDKPADSSVNSSTSATPGTFSNLVIHIGAQPNNSPHTGTIHGLRPRIRPWTCAEARVRQPSPRSPDGEHQRVRYGGLGRLIPALWELAELVDHEVDYKIECQATLTSMPGVGAVMRTIVEDRDRITLELAPKWEALPVRVACPVEGCGLADKHGIQNEYDVGPDHTTITFHCDKHGAHSVQLENEEDIERLEFNAPLRNLVRSLVYMIDTEHSRTDAQAVPGRIHMRVTGSDYAGTYQEQLFYRQLFNLSHTEGLDFKDAITFPFVVYAPLIVDWAGSKLSKSLYLTGKDDAYRYLKDTGRDYLVSFDQMKTMGKDWRVLFRLMEEWVASPKKLFRPYSLEYIFLCSRRRKKGQMRREERGRRRSHAPYILTAGFTLCL
ncbi:hypothetical protein A0H81_10124 [Grifola frondosa]|uniref:Uncharacterized protein n=1 Tax=Grifola frondosa TaxID=5627 RepID=A0A1C7LXL5_GRIFR|nr:hypothetical protein A0H81_10124 [Grifola frondosa]